MSWVETARAAWGHPVPDWVMVLAEQADATSQRRVAAAIRYSTTVVSQVLSKRYPGGLSRVEAAVRGAYQHHTVECPVLGTLPLQDCLEIQRRPYQATNHQAIRLYRACRKCPHNRARGGGQ